MPGQSSPLAGRLAELQRLGKFPPPSGFAAAPW